jgi:hypothetical protein
MVLEEIKISDEEKKTKNYHTSISRDKLKTDVSLKKNKDKNHTLTSINNIFF